MSAINEQSCQPRYVVMIWDGDVRLWQLAGLHETLEELQQQQVRLRSKGYTGFRVFSLQELAAHDA